MQTLPVELLERVARRVNERNLKAVFLAGLPTPRGTGGLPALADAARTELLNRPLRRASLRAATRKALRRTIAPLIGAAAQAMRIVEEVAAGRNTVAAVLARLQGPAGTPGRWHVGGWSGDFVQKYIPFDGLGHIRVAALPTYNQVVFNWVHPGRDPFDQTRPLRMHIMGLIYYEGGGAWNANLDIADPPPHQRYRNRRQQYFKVLQSVRAAVQAAVA